MQHPLAAPNSHIEPISLDGFVAPVKPAMVKRHVKGGNWADFWVARCGQGGLMLRMLSIAACLLENQRKDTGTVTKVFQNCLY